MSKQSYTPGPWDYWSGYNPVDELEAQITTEDGDIVIASYNRQIPEGEANAKLLAAAPDLLEAPTEAAEILWGLGQIGSSPTALEKSAEFKSLIAKATA